MNNPHFIPIKTHDVAQRRLGKAVEMVRAEAREERRSIQTGVEKKHKQVDEKMKEIREDVKQTMERAAQGQALVNADTNARVEALEERELSAEDEYKHEIEALGKKIEKYATSSAGEILGSRKGDREKS